MSVKKYIPDVITSMNLLCGMLGIVCVLDGRVDCAFCLMVAAAVFDFCDGFAARCLGAYSDLGKELDSLSDLVSFGVLPALMMLTTMRACTFSESALCLIPVFVAVMSGVRLAKFNVDERQHESFIGLPTPACAMFCASLCTFIASCPGTFLSTWASGPVFIPLLSVVLGLLLVSEVPMFSLKFGKGMRQDRSARMKLLATGVETAAIVAFVAIMKQDWSLAVLLTMALYIIKNCVYALFKA